MGRSGRREQVIKELVLNRVAKCSQCGLAYRLSDVNVLGSKDDLWFLMLICPHCHQAVGVAAVVRELNLANSAPAVDRAAADVHQRRVRREPVTAADVSAVRDFLSDFDGDFQRLFGKPASSE